MICSSLNAMKFKKRLLDTGTGYLYGKKSDVWIQYMKAGDLAGKAVGKAVCNPPRPLWIEGKGLGAGEDFIWKLPEQGCQQTSGGRPVRAQSG